MIGLRKEALKGANTRRTVKFDGFTMQRMGKGLPVREALNCEIREGTLAEGVGIALYQDKDGGYILTQYAGEVQGLYPVAENMGSQENSARVYLLGKDGWVYLVLPSTGETNSKCQIGEGGEYCAVQGADRKLYHLFAGEKGACGGYAQLLATDRDAVLASCVCGGRYFLGKSSGRVCYSAAYAPTTFDGDADGGGKLYLPADCGEIVGMRATDDLYIFTEREIFRLQVRANTEEFFLERLGYAGGSICPRSMAVVGEGIFFLSVDGAWRVYKDKMERVCTHLPIFPDRAACFTGRCEDTALIDFFQEGVRKRLALVGEGESGYFVECYAELGGNEFCCVANMGYVFVKRGERSFENQPRMQSEEVDFGNRHIKRLKKARLTGKGRAQLRVYTQESMREYEVAFSQGVGETRLFESGRQFSFALFLEQGAEIESMECIFDCMEVGDDD